MLAIDFAPKKLTKRIKNDPVMLF